MQVTLEDLYRLIGELTVENRMLRKHIAELETATPESFEGSE